MILLEINKTSATVILKESELQAIADRFKDDKGANLLNLSYMAGAALVEIARERLNDFEK